MRQARKVGFSPGRHLIPYFPALEVVRLSLIAMVLVVVRVNRDDGFSHFFECVWAVKTVQTFVFSLLLRPRRFIPVVNS
jgi:hypothetical protein